LGSDWDERVLPSIGSEVVKAAVAQYNAESLLTKREEVSRTVRDALRDRAKDFNIILDDVAITHLSFSTEFTKAVEAKQAWDGGWRIGAAIRAARCSTDRLPHPSDPGLPSLRSRSRTRSARSSW